MQLPKDPIKLAVLTALAMAVLALAVALSAVLSPFLMAAALDRKSTRLNSSHT